MLTVDEWYDWLRVFTIGLSIACFYILVQNWFRANLVGARFYKTESLGWGVWAITAFLASIEGLWLDLPLRVRVVAALIGIAVTFKALLDKRTRLSHAS